MNKKVTLKDIAIMQSGIYMKTDSQGEVRYLQVKDVNSENKLDYTQIATVINTGINDKHWLKNGDLLFAAKGGSNYCIQYEGTERSTIASSSFIIIRPVISNILPEFLCCFLNTSSILGMLKNAAVGTGIQVIPQSVMGEIQLDIPSIEVQRLVVEMDRLRKEGECIRSEIDILKQSLQDQLLMDSLNDCIMKEKAYYIVSKARQILGGTISADQCRDYVLALLFLKSASEYYKSNNSFQQDDNSPALRLLVSERSSFDYLCKELDSPELGRLINMALYELEQVNALVTEGYEINKAIDFESNILGDMNARSIKLRELLLLFQEIRLTNATGQLIDVGDLYNQLLYIFAEEAGKKINNVLTPTEVVSLITKLIDGDRKNACLCDPASGSGTLLVEVGKKWGSEVLSSMGKK